MKFMKTAATAAAITALSIAAFAKDVSEQSRDVSSFSEVALKGSMDAEIKVGSEFSVRVVADSDIIDNVLTEVRGGTLYLEMERGSYRNIKKLDVFITVPKLEGLGIYGSGDVDVDGAKSDKFELDLKGSGDATFENSKFGEIEIDLAGSGNIRLDGSCEDLTLDLRGSGDVSARKMECASAEVDLKGSGDISFYASKNVSVSLRGSGDIDVYGRPDSIKSNVRGSGDVNVR